MAKARITTHPVADHYSGPGEKIIEYSLGQFGGLIAFRTKDDGTLRVDLYRHDPEVEIVVGRPVGSEG